MRKKKKNPNTVHQKMIKMGYKFDGKEFEHRKVFKKAYGKVPNGWQIHHVDFCHLNNSVNNLIAVPESLHKYIHNCDVRLNREKIEKHTKLLRIRLERARENRKKYYENLFL